MKRLPINTLITKNHTHNVRTEKVNTLITQFACNNCIHLQFTIISAIYNEVHFLPKTILVSLHCNVLINLFKMTYNALL